MPPSYVPALIINKIVLSHMMAYWKSLLRILEDRIGKSPGGIENFHLLSTLSELFSWNLRLSKYVEYTKASLYGVRIVSNPDTDVLAGKDRFSGCDEDFLYVHQNDVDYDETRQ